MAETQASFVLTVSESKRLIAKGVAAHPSVRKAMESGTVAVCKGTTTAYVLEELLGERIDKSRYVLGRTVPARAETASPDAGMPEVVFRDGQVVPGLDVGQAVKQMSAGDVVIKGANALDYPRRMVGELIGDPSGGTLGKILGAVYGRKLELIIPIGLEKSVASDLVAVSERIRMMRTGGIPSLWPFTGTIITEIEAVRILAGSEAEHMASGGVCGAEGAVWLLVRGQEPEVGVATRLIEAIQGEPPYPG
jgi:hypothetical protein